MERQWNVVVLRPPRGRADDATRPPSARASERPFVVYTGGARARAEETMSELRARGADVVLVEGDEGSWCAAHPTQLCGEACGCGRRICPGCRLAADGAARCAACDARARHKVRNARLRQLFALFVFVAFLHQAWAWTARERALVDATGPVRVAFVQLVRPEAAGAPLVTAMREGGLAEIPRWFESERARYAGTFGPPLRADVLGPWVADVNPPALPARDAGWMDMLRVSLGFPRYFHDLARAHGVDPDAYGARVYVVYGRERADAEQSADLAADSRGSRKGRLAVSMIPVESSLAYAQLTIAHELAHILGAEDRYDEETWLARFPEGYVQPWADPPYPQRYAELMAADVPVSPSTEREVTSLDEVRIGYRTAAELGWIEARQADLYYTPALHGPEQALVQAQGDVGTR